MSNAGDKDEYLLDKNIHFTYKADMDKTSLCQGDVLEITEELETALKEIHPYFVNERYKYFIVLSQSCDLVRRNGKTCKTPYITLAAVRSYSDFLRKSFLKAKMARENKGFLLMDEKNLKRALELVERVYNNTEPEHFFLYKEDALDFPESMVAYLKVSMALKSEEHYDKCLNAKKLELSDEFKAKLGWLLGNMYSRVGTADWEGIMTTQAKQDMIDTDVKSMCIIGNKEQLRKLEDEYLKKEDELHDWDGALKFVSGIEIKTKYDKVMDIIEQTINASGKKIAMEEKEKLIKTIRSRSALKTLIK